MNTVFFTDIRPAEGQSIARVHEVARALGYTLCKFAGWTDEDLGYPGNPGPYYEDARKNLAAAGEIQEACRVKFSDGTVDWPHIIFTVTPQMRDYCEVNGKK